MHPIPLTKRAKVFSWILQMLAAVILLQTLYYKFTGAEESIYIFEKVGMEPWGRYGSGISELIAGMLLLIPRTAWFGALMGLGVISGALFFHFTTLGIEVMGDGGALFYLAVSVFVCCSVILILRRRQLRSDVARLFGK